MERLDKLVEEFGATKFVSARRDVIDDMRDEIAAKITPDRIGKGVPKEIAAVFHGKIKKASAGAYTFTYDFTTPEQMTDFEPGRVMLKDAEPKDDGEKDEDAEDETETSRREPWTVFKEKDKPLLYGAGGRMLYFRPPLQGSVTIEVKLTVKKARNVIITVCDNRNRRLQDLHAYAFTLWGEIRKVFGTDRSIKEQEDDVCRKSACIVKIGRQRRSNRVRCLQKAAFKSRTKTLRIRVQKSGNALVYSLNGKKITAADRNYKNGHAAIGALGGEVHIEKITIVCKPDLGWVKEQYKKLLAENKKEREKEKKAATGTLAERAQDIFGDALSKEDYRTIEEISKWAPDWLKKNLDEKIASATKEDADEVKELLEEYRKMKESWGKGARPPGGNPGGRPGGRPGGGRPGGRR